MWIEEETNGNVNPEVNAESKVEPVHVEGQPAEPVSGPGPEPEPEAGEEKKAEEAEDPEEEGRLLEYILNKLGETEV